MYFGQAEQAFRAYHSGSFIAPKAFSREAASPAIDDYFDVAISRISDRRWAVLMASWGQAPIYSATTTTDMSKIRRKIRLDDSPSKP